MKRIPAQILIASANQGKVKEIRDLVKDLPIEFLSFADLREAPEVIEDGATFEENALKKARILAAATGLVSLADDSGLCVDALDGRPGVLSARYGKEGASDEDKCRLLLEELRDVPDSLRSARFVCVLALVTPDGEEVIFRAECDGRIARELRGSAGFGFDPVFFYPEAGRTFAEMDRDSKNRVSHRGLALGQFSEFLRSLS
jgi:XTP/dITP diphosphohydrolase